MIDRIIERCDRVTKCDCTIGGDALPKYLTTDRLWAITRRTPQNSIDIHDLKDVDVTKRIDRWGFEGPCRACRKWTRRLSSVDDLGCVDRDIRGTAAAV